MSKTARVYIVILVLVAVIGALGVLVLRKPHKPAVATSSSSAVQDQPISLGNYTGPPGEVAEVPAITIAAEHSTPPSTYLVKPGTTLRLTIKSDASGLLTFMSGAAIGGSRSIHIGDNVIDVKFGGNNTYSMVFTLGQNKQLTLGIISPKASQ